MNQASGNQENHDKNRKIKNWPRKWTDKHVRSCSRLFLSLFAFLICFLFILMKWCEALFLILSWYGQWRVFYPSTEIYATCIRFQRNMLHSGSCFEFFYSANKTDVRAFRICDPIEIWISLHLETLLIFTNMWAAQFLKIFMKKWFFPISSRIISVMF